MTYSQEDIDYIVNCEEPSIETLEPYFYSDVKKGLYEPELDEEFADNPDVGICFETCQDNYTEWVRSHTDDLKFIAKRFGLAMPVPVGQPQPAPKYKTIVNRCSTCGHEFGTGDYCQTCGVGKPPKTSRLETMLWRVGIIMAALLLVSALGYGIYWFVTSSHDAQSESEPTTEYGIEIVE